MTPFIQCRRALKSSLVAVALSTTVSLYAPLVYADDAEDAVRELKAEVAAVVLANRTPEQITTQVGVTLRAFLARGALPEAFVKAHPGLPVTTYLLHAEPDGRFSIAVLVLRPGARAPLHDHRTWTVWGTIRGTDHEKQFERGASGEDDFPELRPISDRRVEVGEVSVVAMPPRDVHYVENVGNDVSVSVHVHGADLSRIERNRYDFERRTVFPFVQSYESGGEQ